MKTLFKIGLICLLMCGIVSCKDNDVDDNENPFPEIPGGSGDSSGTLSPEQSKLFLEQTAREALTMLNPDDQIQFIKFCAYFGDTYGDYEFPDNFIVEGQSRISLKNFFKVLAKTVSHADGANITRAVSEYIYSLDFERFKGVYMPNSRWEEWEMVESSNDVIFRYYNANGQLCELKASGSSSVSSGSFNFTVEDDWYGESYDDRYTVNYKLPTQIELSITENGINLLSAVVQSNINTAGHNLSLDVNATVANINVQSNTQATDSKITEKCSIKLGGAPYINSEASITGSHLCDISYYEKYLNGYINDDAFVASLLNEGTGTTTLINKVSIDANMKYSKKLADALDLWTYDLAEAQSFVNTLSNGIKAVVRYNNTATEQAHLGWSYQRYYYSYWDEVEYEIIPLLIFSDGTSYEFWQYFDTGFTSVENLWNSVIRKYESAIESVL